MASGSRGRDCCPPMPIPRDEHLLRRVGGRLQAARNAKGLSQAEVAERVGIATTTLSRYETGDRPIGLSALSRLATALDVEIDALVADVQSDLGELMTVWAQLDEEQRELGVRLLRQLVPRG